VAAPGSLIGGSVVNTATSFAIQWDVPFTVEVAFRASTHPCCNGASADADYLNGVVLRHLDARGPAGAVAEFSVVAESGARLGPNGLMAPVPEPGTAALWLLALAGGGLQAARRRHSSSVKADWFSV
jgi:hypothetical protein